MTTSRKTPVLFVSHGAPTFAIEPGRLGQLLRGVGAQLTGIKAVLVVSVIAFACFSLLCGSCKEAPA